MHPDEITPERFAPAVAAITTALDTLDTQAERGELLAARCEQWLIGAKQRLEAARQQEPNTGVSA